MSTKGVNINTSSQPVEGARPLRCDEVGINLRHSRRCSSREGGPCDCVPNYQGQVWCAEHQRQLRRVFSTIDEAKQWRAETEKALEEPGSFGPGGVFFGYAARRWLKAAEDGVIRTRSGVPYKPSAIRRYGHAIEHFLIPHIGRRRLGEIRRVHVQDLVDQMVSDGYSPSSIRNVILPLRSICRRAIDREEIDHNPTSKLSLPVDRRRKDRVAPPDEVNSLLEVLPFNLRLIWATAIYTGLRRGELQALGWQHVDFDQGTIEVERGWDYQAGFIDPKSRAAFRRLPLPGALRGMLIKQKLSQGGGPDSLVIGDGDKPFDPPNMLRNARRIWKQHDLTGLGYHECRHTYASLMIAAGVNAKTLSTYMGHSSIVMTMDRYGHLFPGNEQDSAAKLDEYLQAAEMAPRHGEAAVIPI